LIVNDSNGSGGSAVVKALRASENNVMRKLNNHWSLAFLLVHAKFSFTSFLLYHNLKGKDDHETILVDMPVGGGCIACV
jgi:hypothetical protein